MTFAGKNKMTEHIKFEEGKPVKLDLGCGDRKQEGHYGIDIAKTDACDYQFDLRGKFPIDDDSVDAIYCSHFLEHLTGSDRVKFMEECWRVLKEESQLTVITPHWSSMRSIQDPTHEWPPICESSFLYFNKGWMDDNKLSHYNIKCNFDFGYGYSLDPDIAVRNQDFQQFSIKHYNNAVMDIFVTLTKKSMDHVTPKAPI